MGDEKGKVDLTNLDIGPGVVTPKPAEEHRTKITFQCGNGHRIVVPAEKAGQRGKCSKCGVAVVIPHASMPPAEAHADPAADSEPRSSAAMEPGPAMPAVAAVDEGGRGSDVDRRESAALSGSQVDMFAGLTDSGAGRGQAPDFAAMSGEIVGSGAAAVHRQSNGVASTALLVARLFEEMQQGGIIELHIEGGSVILPEFYDPNWSAGSHGLFASRAADGTVTLTAVAWESIQRIVVRQVEGLPDGMFE